MSNRDDLIPDNTIVIFTNPEERYLTLEQTKKIIRRPSKKREWFSPNFYRCLPLSIGNQYGFEILAPFSFNAIWDGSDSPEGVTFTFFDSIKNLENKYLALKSHFGHGIITFGSPWMFRTPKNINLMTINPPNHIIPNITVLTGVIETDNLQRDFTFNLKIQEPNRLVSIKEGQPITTLLPIPRYFQDNFKLKFAEDVISDEQITSELQTWNDSLMVRHQEYFEEAKRGTHYMKGLNIYDEPYNDHQGPVIKYDS